MSPDLDDAEMGERLRGLFHELTADIDGDHLPLSSVVERRPSSLVRRRVLVTAASIAACITFVLAGRGGPGEEPVAPPVARSPEVTVTTVPDLDDVVVLEVPSTCAAADHETTGGNQDPDGGQPAATTAPDPLDRLVQCTDAVEDPGAG